MTALDRVVALMPPVLPKAAIGPEDIAAVQEEFNVVLPPDYVDFLAQYGHGSIAIPEFPEGYIHLFSPGNTLFPACDLRLAILDRREDLGVFRTTMPQDAWNYYCPYPPELIVPWGTTIDAHHLIWISQSPDWTTAVIPAGMPFAEFPLRFTEMILSVITGEFRIAEEPLLTPEACPYWTPHQP